MNNEFKTSDTQLEAEWVKSDIVGFKVYKCSNCGATHEVESVLRLTPYCGDCGAKMKNPQYIVDEDDYGY